MKKLLLFTALGSLALGAMAQSTPLLLENFYASGMSSNGRYVSSATYDGVAVYDLEARKYLYQEENPDIRFGQGRHISDNGIILMGDYDTSWLLINGKEVRTDVAISSFNAITPDGKYIAALLYNPDITPGDDNTSYLPAIFTLTDGVLSEPEYLPYPELDFTNRKIQYASAVSISDDGRKVIGLVVDRSGFLQTPILYTKGEDNKWSYRLLAESLINPNHVEIPAYPGDAESWEKFATPEEVAAYNEAYAKWQAETPYDYDKQPQWGNYMTEEEYAAYKVYAEDFNNRLAAFSTAFLDVLDASTGFEQNLIYISPDGNKATAASITSVENNDPMAWLPFKDVHQIYSFDLKDETFSHLESDLDLAPENIIDNGIIFCATMLEQGSQVPVQGYVLEAGNTLTPLLDYIGKTKPEWSEWYKQNFTFDVETGYDPETFEPITTPYVYTGRPYCNADGSTVATAIENWYLDVPYNTVVFTGVTTGVANVAIDGADDLTVKGAKGGMIFVAGPPADVTVYDLSGRVVFAADAVEASVATGLNSGVYVIKATAENGKTVTEKVAF